jgi:hypothetical protein
LLVRPDPAPIDSVPVTWLEYIDPTVAPPPAHRIILASYPSAYAVFTDRVIDSTAWPADFAMSVIVTLAKKLDKMLAQTPGDAEPLPRRPGASPEPEMVLPRKP